MAEKPEEVSNSGIVGVGPAKGYIEALEIRLKETERVLWRILSACPQENLTAAFSPEVQDRIPQHLSVGTLGTTEEKKSAIAYWEQFPLYTIEDVLTWKQQIESPPLMETTNLGQDQEQHSHLTNSPGEAQDQGPPSPMDEEMAQASVAKVPSSQNLSDASYIAPQMTDAPNRRPSASTADRESVVSKFSFSKEFQETFLW
ncbi:uncharacterized protein Z519_05670 [Cladophialophora bantiana CBS 173.52]|uniref:Uncharacterized protein n=1 Tax=Cladophialophora bantiana (strain ATCC 10958 / CBS 173.52 / CDC B-1940 / NIH 8579) TaxID=1442370 RepID=A0A0D2IC37_CLAB1|nr:uncharacterized protein Z519_05670 [Cladophialophora bantiana CBS 173.52]KIW94354.1 hypothetical protein Z519_05670 [Cladophialophora bantiana CBS 173.52]